MAVIYCIPGLGADDRLFRKLDLQGHDIHYVQWVRPRPKESFNEYAQRLSKQIKHKNPILLGVSLGGMMSVEVSGVIPVKKIILISSLKSSQEKPPYLIKQKRYNLQNVLPIGLMKQFVYILKKVKGGMSKPDYDIFKAMLKNTDPVFFRWALRQILHWENPGGHAPAVHFHGTKDILLPSKNIKEAHFLDAATHFMFIERAEELQTLILKEIDE